MRLALERSPRRKFRWMRACIVCGWDGERKSAECPGCVLNRWLKGKLVAVAKP